MLAEFITHQHKMAAGSGRRGDGRGGWRERVWGVVGESLYTGRGPTGEKKLWKREVGRGCGVVELPD